MVTNMIGLSTLILACFCNIVFEGIHLAASTEYKSYCVGDKVDGFYGNPVDSTTYYQCYRLNCPSGHHFSEETQACQPSSEVTCPVHSTTPTTSTNPPTTTTTTTTDPPTTTTNPPTTTTSPPTTTTTNPPTTTTTSTTTEPTTTTPTTTTTVEVTTVDLSIFTCTQVGRFGDPFDCVKYHVCSYTNGEWIDKVYSCQSGTVFCQRYAQCYYTTLCPCELLL